MKVKPRCPGITERNADGDEISGVGVFDHRWVEGPSYDAPNPEDGQPAKWHDLVCEECGVINPGWVREPRP